MRLLVGILIFAVSCILLGCPGTNDPSAVEISPVNMQADSLVGMLNVDAVDAFAVLGTDDAKARANERPKMNVTFDYSFSLSRHEVTCGEFNALMTPSFGAALPCENGDLPAVDVTYYDAVLFANARSKAENFDTAYTYIRAVFDAQNHCTNLDGFAFHPEAKAYRLPTEAEWVLVAGQTRNVGNGWTAENSDYKLHPVCNLAPDGEFCDMAGNAMEWVNDWLGNFGDTSVANFVGAPDGGSLGQRIVKGGSFRNEASSITLYGRGDIYTVTSSTRADYVGFRIAFGAIPSATWMGKDGKVSGSRIVPIASSSVMHSVAGAYRAKLAFRNDLTGNLAYIDYSNAVLSVVEITDTINVYHPEISPNGMRVAFCTGLEGTPGKSSLYVRDLNADGTNLVRLDVESAAIPRWRVLENGDTVIVYVSSADNNKDSAIFNTTSTWQVPFANGTFGVPQKLFDGAYHGGISDDNTLAVTGARLLRARIADANALTTGSAIDVVWYNGEQACNAALAKDGSKRTLFLDFGGKTGREFVGADYGTHERLLIVDSTGTLIQSVAAPAGYSFDHTEWAGATLVVATLTNMNGAHQKVVLINLVESGIVELVEGEELWHPSLWTLQNAQTVGLDLAPDSAGFYYNEKGGEDAIILRYKMELLWKYRDTANLVVLGSSRPLGGVNPLLLSNEFFGLNLANVPNMVFVSDYLATHYIFPHVKNLKYLVVSLDIDLWFHEERSEYNFFFQEYREYPGYIYDENHDFWINGIPEKMVEMTENSMGLDHYALRFRDTRGFNIQDCASWEEKPAIEYDSTWKSTQPSTYYASFNHLKNILMMAENNGVYVIGIVFPQSPAYRNTGAFGRYGLRRSEVPALLQELQDLTKEYPHFVFMDENKMGEHDYPDEFAQNRDHLCASGAVQLTARLDSVLKTLK